MCKVGLGRECQQVPKILQSLMGKMSHAYLIVVSATIQEVNRGTARERHKLVLRYSSLKSQAVLPTYTVNSKMFPEEGCQWY